MSLFRQNLDAGTVVTGPAAAGFSDMTEGAAAVIPEVLAGQILSLARRGSGGPGHTVLAASRDDCLARDRLVVLLQPILAAGRDGNGESDRGGEGGPTDRKAERSREQVSAAGAADQGARTQRKRRQANTGDPVMPGADERPRHALVLPCVPGQVKPLRANSVAVFMRNFGDEALCGSDSEKKSGQSAFWRFRPAHHYETTLRRVAQHITRSIRACIPSHTLPQLQVSRFRGRQGGRGRCNHPACSRLHFLVRNITPRTLGNSFRYFSAPFALRCAYTKISQEDIAVATELARAADEAERTIQRRQRRQFLMDRCAEDVEELCRGRTQSFEGKPRRMAPLCAGTTTAPHDELPARREENLACLYADDPPRAKRSAAPVS